MTVHQRGLPDHIQRARQLYTHAIQEFEQRGADGWVKIYKKKLTELPMQE